MAKIYCKKYKTLIDAGEITLEQALRLVETEVPKRWRDEVIKLLNENRAQ